MSFRTKSSNFVWMSDIVRYTDEFYMARALQIARNGLGSISPNPMVGAVIVASDGRIIGEGFHRRYGEAHAEVNAVNSVSDSDRDKLRDSTIYVTLEPCSHYGKTPPCAKLLKDVGFRRVVVGTGDPFEKVSGRGIDLLRDAGIEVTTGILQDECRSLNARFFTSHTLRRPFILLKWAQSADGYMDIVRTEGQSPAKFSDTLGLSLVHRLRTHFDSIGIGSETALRDKPALTVRYWHGDNPERVVFDRRGRVGEATGEIEEVLRNLYEHEITSIIVEGGPTLIKSFIEQGLWDLIRVEVSPLKLGVKGYAQAYLPNSAPLATRRVHDNTIYYYSNNQLVNNYFIDNAL